MYFIKYLYGKLAYDIIKNNNNNNNNNNNKR